jgi:DNA-binding MarR family transcriptional regulator
MRLEKLSDALRMVKAEFDIDATDAMLLSEILAARKEKGEVAIMEIVENSKVASPATLHGRIKKLVTRNLLTKVTDESNMRFKKLEPGTKLEALHRALSEV